MNRSRKPSWKRHRSPASHHAGTSYREPDASARLPWIRRFSMSATPWSSARFSLTCPGVITSGGGSCCRHCSRKAIAKRRRESSLRREPLGCVFRTTLASVSWSPSELTEALQRSSRMRTGRSSKRRASVSVSMSSRRNDGSLLSELPLPRRIEAGPRQLNGPHSIHKRTSGENRERREIRTPEAFSFTAQESDQLPVMPGLRSYSRARDGRPGGIAGGEEQQRLLSEVPGKSSGPGKPH